MSRYFPMMLACVVLLTLMSDVHAAAPAEKPVDAAALVREVRAAEGWVDTVKSFSFKIEGGGKRPETIVMGRDEKRFYFSLEMENYTRRVTWDGNEAIAYGNQSKQEYYNFYKDPWNAGDTFLVGLPVPRATEHKSQWVRERKTLTDSFYGDPEDFRVSGHEKFRGVDCYVLDSDLGYRTLYVGVADHRLYGKTNRVRSRFANNSVGPTGMQIARDMGHDAKNEQDLSDWLLALPPQDRKHFFKEQAKQLRPWSRPQLTNWFEDYKELAPGCWLPMRQGTDQWNTDADITVEPKVTYSTEMKVTQASVNQPIGDEPFKWEMIEGVQVTDLRHDPVLRYKYKKHFEPIEWEAIVEEANQQKIRRRPESGNSAPMATPSNAVGKPAPEFPAASQWINTQPLKIADLKGKVVIIECSAGWSKFCWDDIAKLNRQFDSGDKDIVVISIHAAGTPVEELRKWVSEHKIKYPVCLDTPGDKGPWEGGLFNAYHVMDIPICYVIDQQGKVKQWSDFDSAVKRAHEMTGQGAK